MKQNSIGAMEEGQRRFGSQAFRKASTFGRFQILRSAHIFRSVACDAAALGVQSPSIHVDSTSLKPSELAFGTHETKLHWGDGVDLSPGEHSHTAGKVRGNATSSVQRRVVSQSLHWGHGRRSEKVWITGIQKSEHFWEVSNFAECSHIPQCCL